VCAAGRWSWGSARSESCRPLAATLTDQPWGLRDFSVVDPDGYYLRVTHRDAATEQLD
jgi:hypothetical protein